MVNRINENSQILISDKQVKNFKNGQAIESEFDIRASRGAYFINAQMELNERRRLRNGLQLLKLTRVVRMFQI